jgi:hypothetical protein
MLSSLVRFFGNVASDEPFLSGGGYLSSNQRFDDASDALGTRQEIHHPEPRQDAEPEQSGAGKDEGAGPVLPQFHENSSDDRCLDRAMVSATTALNA